MSSTRQTIQGTRFEFGGTGIFHAIDLLYDCEMEVADEEEIQWAENYFDKYMPIPDEASNITGTKSYFTNAGLKRFQKPLNILLDAFEYQAEEAGFGQLQEIKCNISTNDIVYRDKYQIITQ